MPKWIMSLLMNELNSEILKTTTRKKIKKRIKNRMYVLNIPVIRLSLSFDLRNLHKKYATSTAK
jgi:hypothetical protein